MLKEELLVSLLTNLKSWLVSWISMLQLKELDSSDSVMPSIFLLSLSLMYQASYQEPNKNMVESSNMELSCYSLMVKQLFLRSTSSLERLMVVLTVSCQANICMVITTMLGPLLKLPSWELREQ
jgi:hypothetical protein